MSPDLPSLAADLASDDRDTRRHAAESLAQRGEDAAEAAVSLTLATIDEDESTREWAVAALESLGRPPTGAVAELTRLLDHPSLDVPYWAATLLGRCAADARSAVPTLDRVTRESPHAAVRRRGALALGRILAANTSNRTPENDEQVGCVTRD